MFDLNALPDDFGVFLEGVEQAGVCLDLVVPHVLVTRDNHIFLGGRIPRELYSRAADKYGHGRMELSKIRYLYD